MVHVPELFVTRASWSARGGYRVAVALVAVAALVAGIALAARTADLASAVLPLVAGGLGFCLLPFLVGAPSGGPHPSGEGVRYILGRSAIQGSGRIGQWLGIVSLPVVLVASPFAAFVLASFAASAVVLVAWALADRLWWADRDAPAITLDPTTLSVRRGLAARVFRYVDLLEIELHGTSIRLTTPTERFAIHVSSAERAEPIFAAILAAKDRAERAANEPNRLQQTLGRETGMHVRAWLDKVDAAAATARAAGAYRGAGLGDPELWSTLADEDADPDTRAAAARLLARSPDAEVRTRVATFAKDIPREAVRIRVELAMKDDVAAAAAELEALEQAEMAAETRG